MADRVHPTVSSPPQQKPLPEKPIPPPSATYVIQVPKDQIYRIPPKENSKKFAQLTKKPRRSCCCRCFCYTLSLLLLLLFLIALAAGILYLVYRPEAPKYSVDSVSIRGINLTSSAAISPAIDVTVRARNINDKLGIYYYDDNSAVDLFYSSVKLCNGVVPRFNQQANNVTVFVTALKGSNIVLGNGVRTALMKQQREGNVPLKLKLKVPVKIKVGAVKTWKITVKIDCDLTVDKLTAASKIISKSCDYSVKLW